MADMSSLTPSPSPSPAPRSRRAGLGRVLVSVYAVLALAALGRSFVQIMRNFAEAPVAFSLSALAALVYAVATVALAWGDRTRVLAWLTVSFELLGVLVVGILSLFDAALFPRDTVWSHFGAGYLFVPLFLPVLGLVWLRLGRRAAQPA